MHGTKDIIEEATALPAEDRAYIVDSLLRTLNTPDPNVDTIWIDIAQNRLMALRSNHSGTISETDVFSAIQKRFSK